MAAGLVLSDCLCVAVNKCRLICKYVLKGNIFTNTNNFWVIISPNTLYLCIVNLLFCFTKFQIVMVVCTYAPGTLSAS